MCKKIVKKDLQFFAIWTFLKCPKWLMGEINLQNILHFLHRLPTF